MGCQQRDQPAGKTMVHQRPSSLTGMCGCRRLEATAAYSSFLREEVLAPSDTDPSAGFSLHVADIIVQELRSACEDAPVPAPALQVQSAADTIQGLLGRKLPITKHAGGVSGCLRCVRFALAHLRSFCSRPKR